MNHGGRGSGYGCGCRCYLCTEAHRVRIARRRVERYAMRVVEDGRLVCPVETVEHGRPSTYANWGCQCEPCKDAHSQAMAAAHARRAQ